MGNCRYCTKKAGLFKDVHEECQLIAEEVRGELKTAITTAVEIGNDTVALRKELEAFRERARFSQDEMQRISWEIADIAIQEFVMRSPVSNEEADRVGNILSLIDPDCFKNAIKFVNWPGFLSLSHSNVLYQVLHREVPYYDPAGFNDFRFAEGEHPILRRFASLAEYRTLSGGHTYQSVSLPIGAGMYYRLGASQPRTQQTGLVPVADGLLVITTQALYFNSPQDTFRISYDSILRIEPFVDGFGIYENHGAGKVFIPALLGKMDEGWYFHNLVSALMAW